MRNRNGVILTCTIIIALMPLACFAGMSISQNDYINKYNQSIAGYGFEDQATIISPLNDTYTYYMAKNKTILSRSHKEESYSFAICIDETTDKVVAVQVLFDDEFLLATSTEEKQLISSICKAMIDGFCEVSKDKQEAIIKKVLLNIGELNNDVRFYDTGFVFQSGYEGNSPIRSGTSFSITAVDQDDFNSGLYWTPRSSLEYFIQAGDMAMAENDFDTAILYYEQSRELWKLEQAYRAKADNLRAQGDIEGAKAVLEYGGLGGTADQAGVNANNISDFSGQEQEDADDMAIVDSTTSENAGNEQKSNINSLMDGKVQVELLGQNNNTPQSSSVSMVTYVNAYNESLRASVKSTSANTNVADSTYISGAKTLINNELTNPSSATYNEASVYEKDNYGKAIVYLDVSAQNGFGGWVRTQFYVCINNVNSDDTFTYSSLMPYIDNMSTSLYNTLKGINDFGVDPVDIELKGLLLDESAFVFNSSQKISPPQTLDSYMQEVKYGNHYIYIDTASNNVVSVWSEFEGPSSPDQKEQVKKVCTAMATALSGKTESVYNDSIDAVFDINSLSPVSEMPVFLDGYVYDCAYRNSGVGFAVTVMEESEYKSGTYWTPNTSTVYFEKVGEQYLKNKEYDYAITNFVQAGTYSDSLMEAYYQKAAQYLADGNFNTAIEYFSYAGSYRDSAVKVLEVHYNAGMSHEKVADYSSAIQSYSMAGGYSDAKEKYKECSFTQGEIYLGNKEYLDAIACFKNASDYSGAAEKCKEANYLYGEQQLLLGHVDVAAQHFYEATGYKDADTRIQKHFYNTGCSLLALKDYITAADTFAKAAGYSDSSDKQKQCYYEYGKAQLAQGYTTEGTKYLGMCRGYADTDDVLFSFYYSQASEKYTTLLASFPVRDFTWRVDDAYNAALEYLKLCEGYKDSKTLIQTAKKLYDIWSNGQIISGYGLNFGGFSVSTDRNVIVIEQPNFMNGTNSILNLAFYPESSNFDAKITDMFTSSMRENDQINAVATLLKLLTDVTDTMDLEAILRDENKWTISSEEESISLSYGGYSITISGNKSDYYYMMDCTITVFRQ